MKKLLKFCLIVFIALSLSNIISSSSVKADCIGGSSVVNILSLHAGMGIDFTGHSGFAGLIGSTIDGNPMDVYCVDLHHNVGLPDLGYTETCIYATNKVQYILNNYFPYKTGYSGQLGDNQEAASIQAAIWAFTDGIDLSSITDPTIQTRALIIKNDADANGAATPSIITFFLHPGIDPDAFFVETRDENNNPISIDSITVSITEGSLDNDTNDIMTATNASGVSPEIMVSGAGNGAVITARARMLYAHGRVVGGTTPGKQQLTIAYPVYGMMSVSIEWGALPVELASFTSSVSGSNVALNWTTASEVNNSGFKVERSIGETGIWTIVASVAGNGTSTLSHQYTYTDRGLNSGNYAYRLKQVDYNGNYEYFNLNSEVIIGIPTKYSLSQNYPNPFNPTTKIQYSIPYDGVVSIKVFDLTGKEVATLANEFKTAGSYAADLNGSNLASGNYYYRIQAGEFLQTKKMTLIK